MMDAKPIHTPLPTSLPITLHYGSSLKDLTKYRTIVVSVQYLLITRPDIAFTVNKLSQYMHQPTTEHWIFMKRLLHYLCGSSSDGIQLYHDPPPSLYMPLLMQARSLYMPFSILTKLETRMISHLLVPMLFTLVVILSHGVPRSKERLLDLPRRLNIGR